MVGSLLLLKILHHKRYAHNENKAKRSRITKNVDKTSRKISQRVSVKKEKNEVLSCRICLKEGSIPIFGDDRTDNISEDLNYFCRITILINDPYPKFICKSCYALLQGAILLRKSAQQSDEILHYAEDKVVNEYNGDFGNNDDNASFFEDQKPKHRIYYCKTCEINFNSLYEYQDHRMTEEHENKKKTCPICNKSYGALYFKKHLAIHSIDSVYVCDICGKKFAIQGHFARHRVTHFYHLPFKCSLCPYKGRFSESLKMHMRSHTGDKPYRCEQCPDRSFINKSNLNKHMLTHKGAVDYTCEACGKGFYTKREMEQHFKVDHTGIKDHICNICNKAFGYRKQMMKHQLKVHKRAKLKSGRTPLYLQVEANTQLNNENIETTKHHDNIEAAITHHDNGNIEAITYHNNVNIEAITNHNNENTQVLM